MRGDFRRRASLPFRVKNVAFGLEWCTGEVVWGAENERRKGTEIGDGSGRIIFVNWRRWLKESNSRMLKGETWGPLQKSSLKFIPGKMLKTP